MENSEDIIQKMGGGQINDGSSTWQETNDVYERAMPEYYAGLKKRKRNAIIIFFILVFVISFMTYYLQ